MRVIKVAMAQMSVKAGDIETNLARAESMIAQAAEAGCKFVVLPECMDAGWTEDGAAALAQPIPGATSDRLCRSASRNGIHVVSGLTELDEEAGRIYNAAVLISPAGEILSKHRKINEIDFARNIYSLGSSLNVVRTGFGAVGVVICADQLIPGNPIGDTVGYMGADLLLSPSAWAVDADYDHAAHPYGSEWRTAYTAVAKRHRMGVVGVSNVGLVASGEWSGRQCIGCSLAVGPDGTILVEGRYGADAEELIVVEMPAPD